jgi:hypothetical protein
VTPGDITTGHGSDRHLEGRLILAHRPKIRHEFHGQSPSLACRLFLLSLASFIPHGLCLPPKAAHTPRAQATLAWQRATCRSWERRRHDAGSPRKLRERVLSGTAVIGRAYGRLLGRAEGQDRCRTVFSRPASALPAHAPRAQSPSKATYRCVALVTYSALNCVGAADRVT